MLLYALGAEISNAEYPSDWYQNDINNKEFINPVTVNCSVKLVGHINGNALDEIRIPISITRMRRNGVVYTNYEPSEPIVDINTVGVRYIGCMVDDITHDVILHAVCAWIGQEKLKMHIKLTGN